MDGWKHYCYNQNIPEVKTIPNPIKTEVIKHIRGIITNITIIALPVFL